MGEISFNVQDMSLSSSISWNILLVPLINDKRKPRFLLLIYIVLTFNMTSNFWFHYLVLLKLTNPNHVLDSLPILEISLVTYAILAMAISLFVDTTLLLHCFIVHQGSTCSAYIQIICIVCWWYACSFKHTRTRSHSLI